MYRISKEALLRSVLVAIGLVIISSGCIPTSSPVIPTSSSQNTATRMPEPTTIPTETPSLTPTLTPVPQVRLAAVGDLMLARTIGEKIQAEGSQVVFSGVQPIFDMADILVGNLECAISDQGLPQIKGYTFTAPLDSLQSLKLAGFDLLALANNHAMDYGVEGLLRTQSLLMENGIAYVGTGVNETEARSPVIIEKNGLRLAFLGYVDVPVEVRGFDTHAWIATENSAGLAWAYPEKIAVDVALARSQVDVVIVMLHAGYEGILEPNYIQQQAAYAAIDAGAALVIGAHPHVLQPVEWYKGGVIAYSLGNFVFDDFHDVIGNRTAVMFATVDPEGVRSLEWIPVVIDEGLPRLAGGEDAHWILDMVSP